MVASWEKVVSAGAEKRHTDEPSCLLYSLAMSSIDISTSSSEIS